LENVVECRGLVKRFGAVWALRGLDLHVPRGRVFGFIGPNGAGKTTTIRICLGLLRPDAGEVRLFGEDPWNNPDVRALVGVLHEQMAFPEHLRVRKFLEHVARIYGVREARKAALSALEIVELEEAADRKISALSAGMRQRLGIAQALIHEPELVIADEPTANLDPLGRMEILNLMARLHKDEGVSFFISSHILPELARICDYIALIHEGRVRISGELDELMDKFGRAFRISVSRPEELLRRVEELPYVRAAYVMGSELMVEVEEGSEAQFYADATGLARELGLELYGIDSRVATLEDLFKRIVRGSGGE